MCVCKCMCMCVWVCMRAHACVVCACVYLCVHTHTYRHRHIYKYTHTHTHNNPLLLILIRNLYYSNNSYLEPLMKFTNLLFCRQAARLISLKPLYVVVHTYVHTYSTYSTMKLSQCVHQPPTGVCKHKVFTTEVSLQQ